MPKITFNIISLLVFVFSITGPGLAQDLEMMRPLIDGKERPCLDCHRTPNIQTNEGVFSSQALCYECHAQAAARRKVGDLWQSLQVTPDAFQKNRHAYAACIHCHTDVARSPHKSVSGAQCQACHTVHGEGKVHDPHLRVSCQACHRQSRYVLLDRSRDQVRLSGFNDQGLAVALTDHSLPPLKDKEACRKCHYPANKVGANASVLPAKSALCLLCHNAPLALGHPIFWGAFLILIIGMLLTVFFWFQGTVQGEEQSRHRKMALGSEAVWGRLFSRELGPILKTVFFDIFMQRRLLQESVKRWSIHSLIYLSILLRLGLSLFTLFVFRISPGSALAQALIDKNNAGVAFTNDFLGLLIVLGLLWALTQRFVLKPPHVLSEGRDNLALALIGSLIFLGFIAEGARILITRLPAEKAVYAFIGYPLSNLFSWIPWDWQVLYAYLWYAHAVVGALFIAYLPFGKMKHILVTPLTLLLNYKRK